jgi:hypothetical protein
MADRLRETLVGVRNMYSLKIIQSTNSGLCQCTRTKALIQGSSSSSELCFGIHPQLNFVWMGSLLRLPQRTYGTFTTMFVALCSLNTPLIREFVSIHSLHCNSRWHFHYREEIILDSVIHILSLWLFVFISFGVHEINNVSLYRAFHNVLRDYEHL